MSLDMQSVLSRARRKDELLSAGVSPEEILRMDAAGEFTISARSLNLCGQNANGTFSEGNTCAAGGNDGPHGFTVSDKDRPLALDGPRSMIYNHETLAAAGDPAKYEGATLVDGQTLWDRYSIPSATHLKSAPDAMISTASQPILGGYDAESETKRSAAQNAMPLRRQASELAAIGAAAIGANVDHARELLAIGKRDRPKIHSPAWIAEQFSSSTTNELMVELSRTRPRTSAQEDSLRRLTERIRSSEHEDNIPTKRDVDQLISLARETKLPPGVILWHGWKISTDAERQKLDSLSSSQAEFTNDTLLSTTTRPSIAATFGKIDSYSPTMRKAKSDNRIASDGSMATVIRILGQRNGLPIAGASYYTNEAEVTLAPSRFRFTGKKSIVYMPAANDTGWPQFTFRTEDQKYGEDDRVLFPVAVYDVVPSEEGAPR